MVKTLYSILHRSLDLTHSPIDLKLALGSMMGNVKRKNEKGSVRNDVY